MNPSFCFLFFSFLFQFLLFCWILTLICNLSWPCLSFSPSILFRLLQSIHPSIHPSIHQHLPQDILNLSLSSLYTAPPSSLSSIICYLRICCLLYRGLYIFRRHSHSRCVFCLLYFLPSLSFIISAPRILPLLHLPILLPRLFNPYSPVCPVISSLSSSLNFSFLKTSRFFFLTSLLLVCSASPRKILFFLFGDLVIFFFQKFLFLFYSFLMRYVLSSV